MRVSETLDTEYITRKDDHGVSAMREGECCVSEFKYEYVRVRHAVQLHTNRDVEMP